MKPTIYLPILAMTLIGNLAAHDVSFLTWEPIPGEYQRLGSATGKVFLDTDGAGFHTVRSWEFDPDGPTGPILEFSSEMPYVPIPGNFIVALEGPHRRSGPSVGVHRGNEYLRLREDGEAVYVEVYNDPRPNIFWDGQGRWVPDTGWPVPESSSYCAWAIAILPMVSEAFRYFRKKREL